MITSANHQHRNPNWIFCTVDGMIGVTSGGMNVVHIEWFLREMPIPGNRQKNSLMSQYSHSSQIWVFIRKTFFRGQNIEFILQLSLWPKAFGNDSKVGIIAKKMFFLTGIFTQITNTWSVQVCGELSWLVWQTCQICQKGLTHSAQERNIFPCQKELPWPAWAGNVTWSTIRLCRDVHRYFSLR